MKLRYLAAGAVLMILVAAPAMAQGGCVDSPENPTALLAVVGSAGGAFVMLRNRLRRK
jgi:XrtJ-associated TM-motif-TM protein